MGIQMLGKMWTNYYKTDNIKNYLWHWEGGRVIKPKFLFNVKKIFQEVMNEDQSKYKSIIECLFAGGFGFCITADEFL